ncbi:unnamed protein product [Caenorhabditis angaria]|uniref:Apple domain-containing protein n=1 Tax=Caenorhabditis angaria TaxID=860376 RepID=A0A9P1N7K0_9PELO|nr:unnamed protein product [Caenorhabditis angaria]
MLKNVVFFFILSIFTVIEVQSSLQCFNVHSSHAISNSDPVAELFHVTAGDCLNYCIYESAKKGDGCVSVVFHRKFNTCQLYGHDGTYNGAEVVYLEDHEFYIRSSWEGPCQDPIQPVRGYKQKPNFEIFAFPNSPIPSESEFENLLQQQLEEEENIYEFATTTVSSVPKSLATFKNPTHAYKCSKGETLQYFLVYSALLSTKQLPQRLNGVDRQSCLMYCNQNRNAIGENVPCYSLNYEPNEEICEMYGKQNREQKTWAQLEIGGQHVFADKFCVKAKRDCPLETLYPVYLQKQITSDVISHIPGLNSKVACLAECIDNRSCEAITYKTGMCVLHSVSPSKNEVVLSKGSEQTMVIENGCHTSSRLETTTTFTPSESSWEEWSLCQYGSKGRRMRVRQRECNDDCDEDLQMEEC